MVLRSLFHLSLSVGISYLLVNMDIGARDSNFAGHAMATQPYFCMLLQFCRCIFDIADALVHCCPEHSIILRDIAAALSEIFCDLLPIERLQRFIALLYKTSRHIAACLS